MGTGKETEIAKMGTGYETEIREVNPAEAVSVPYAVYEGERARHEKEKVRWFVVVIVLIMLLFGTNAAWIAYESQYEDIVVSQEVDTDDGSAYVTGVGDSYYGESEAES